ncbi:hypothetical protein [Flavobacterium xanthum]|uniref:Uncharacterized protein n=1 Tax=Flavobacterium xanthum TaxID=69322 RepID=A0A1M7B0F4_9FLAO|nr:hypothetical protein [Flavobacterium xanthum]SHL48367.1 hypothetical protein SAMN05443669_100832 [Flavobacterium xanthum]
MKKLVFTALAVVAFSAVAMAKTGEVKGSDLLSYEDTDCVSETADKMDCLDPENKLSAEEANKIYQILYNNCIGAGPVNRLTQG